MPSLHLLGSAAARAGLRLRSTAAPAPAELSLQDGGESCNLAAGGPAQRGEAEELLSAASAELRTIMAEMAQAVAAGPGVAHVPAVWA